MPERAEYSLNGRKVRELRQQLLVLGQRAWDQLKPMGFTQWNETEGWIGCWMERKRGDHTDSFSIQLEHEEPLSFRIELKLASMSPNRDLLQPSFTRTFETITSLLAEFPKVMWTVLSQVTQ
jgi:hypothetical protein